MDSYFTLQSNIEVSGEFVDRKSRFIAQLVHIESEDEANAFIETVRKRHYDARHNVPAWILVDGRERQQSAEWADKPGSVVNGHLSCLHVTVQFHARYPNADRAGP